MNPMKFALRTLLAAAAVALLVGPAAARRDDDDPDKFAPKGGKFAVAFPAKPKESRKTLKSDAGDTKFYQALYADGDGNVYSAGYLQFPMEIPADQNKGLFDGFMKGVAGDDGEISSKKDGKFGPDKLPMRDSVVERDGKFVRVRMIIFEDRMFFLMLLGTEKFTKSKQATAFINSFEIKD